MKGAGSFGLNVQATMALVNKVNRAVDNRRIAPGRSFLGEQRGGFNALGYRDRMDSKALVGHVSFRRSATSLNLP